MNDKWHRLEELQDKQGGYLEDPSLRKVTQNQDKGGAGTLKTNQKEPQVQPNLIPQVPQKAVVKKPAQEQGKEDNKDDF